MKYLSIFVAILLIWIGSLLIVGFRQPQGVDFELYLLTSLCTLILFLIGFGKK